jgi:Ca-activated chloride channel family protein
MRSVLLSAIWLLAGCGAAAQGASPKTSQSASGVAVEDTSTTSEAAVATTDEPTHASGTWIGASAESDLVLAGSDETTLGVWVDAPNLHTGIRPKVDLALVIDTSGSMAGVKIENARSAARQLVQSLHDGDIVAIDTFSDDAHVLVPPTAIDATTRPRLLNAISQLRPAGSTNMFDGLSLGESQTGRAPQTHAVRRLIMISDGIANVGPSSPESLGVIAERGVRTGTQVTSLGVGIDYDEHTLNALAVRSSGRLYHLTEATEMASILQREMDLLGSSVASDAFVEIVPAPGVQLVPVDGVRTEWGGSGTLRIPLGVLYGGQHREALVRARFHGMSEPGGPKPLASVRLHFHDPSEGDLERVQEVVARVELTNDGAQVASHMNARTRSIVAIQDAAKLELAAAQSANAGQLGQADDALATAQKKLKDEAGRTKDARERQRLSQVADSIGGARKQTQAAAAAPAPSRPAAVRANALELNSSAMHANGY